VAEALREVRDLKAWYDQSHALQGMTLDVGVAEIVSLVGRNGHPGQVSRLGCRSPFLRRVGGDLCHVESPRDAQ